MSREVDIEVEQEIRELENLRVRWASKCREFEGKIAITTARIEMLRGQLKLPGKKAHTDQSSGQ